VIVTALAVAVVVFALVFGGALLGMYLRTVLSEEHLREDVRDTIKLTMGLIGTMAALVLSLLIASAKGSYDTQTTQIKQITANIIQIDLDLEQYGPDAQTLRVILRRAVPALIDQIWNEGDHPRVQAYSATAEGLELVRGIQQLQPANDSKRALQAQVLNAVANLVQARLSLFTQSNSAIPTPFLSILIFWLAMIFTCFGLLVRGNRVVLVTFFVGGLSVACAIFLILEMGQPFTGLMQISRETPRHALAPLGP
jgi:hypothetical protein